MYARKIPRYNGHLGKSWFFLAFVLDKVISEVSQRQDAQEKTNAFLRFWIYLEHTTGTMFELIIFKNFNKSDNYVVEINVTNNQTTYSEHVLAYR